MRFCDAQVSTHAVLGSRNLRRGNFEFMSTATSRHELRHSRSRRVFAHPLEHCLLIRPQWQSATSCGNRRLRHAVAGTSLCAPELAAQLQVHLCNANHKLLHESGGLAIPTKDLRTFMLSAFEPTGAAGTAQHGII